MTRIEMQIMGSGQDIGRVMLDLFELKSVGTGMARVIPGGAAITIGGTPTEKLGQEDDGIGLTLTLSMADDASLSAVSDWFRGKMAKRPNVRMIIQGKECRFEDGELKKLLESKINT